MPVAGYGTDKYREWNRERMRRYRAAGYGGDARYEASVRGQFMRTSYEWHGPRRHHRGAASSARDQDLIAQLESDLAAYGVKVPPTAPNDPDYWEHSVAKRLAFLEQIRADQWCDEHARQRDWAPGIGYWCREEAATGMAALRGDELVVALEARFEAARAEFESAAGKLEQAS